MPIFRSASPGSSSRTSPSSTYFPPPRLWLFSTRTRMRISSWILRRPASWTGRPGPVGLRELRRRGAAEAGTVAHDAVGELVGGHRQHALVGLRVGIDDQLERSPHRDDEVVPVPEDEAVLVAAGAEHLRD